MLAGGTPPYHIALALVSATVLAEATRRDESCDATRHRLARLLREFEQGTPPADDTAFIVIARTSTN